jgi:hypothetical protein
MGVSSSVAYPGPWSSRVPAQSYSAWDRVVWWTSERGDAFLGYTWFRRPVVADTYPRAVLWSEGAALERAWAGDAERVNGRACPLAEKCLRPQGGDG